MRPMPELRIEMVPVDELVPYENNARIHNHEDVDLIAQSIEEFNFADPVGAWHDENGDAVIVEGHGRLMAAKKLGIKELPVIFLDYMTSEQRKQYGILHNKLTDNSEFDFAILEREFETMPDFDWEGFGFDMSFELEGLERGEIVNSSEEIDVESFNDDKFEHECPRCGFRFNE